MSDSALTFPLADVQQMAAVVAKSKLFGTKTEDEAMALMLLAQAEGMHPMRAVQQYHIIQGRPAMKSEAILARFQAAGGVVRWLVSDADEAKATFTTAAREEITVHWTMDRAKAAGLAGKDNWKSYAPQMLRARCIAEGVRAVAPGCILGLAAVEEVEDVTPTPATVIATEPGKGVAGLAAAVAQIAPLATSKADPERARKLAEVRRRMKADGVSSPEQARQYVADNLGGLVVDKLDDLRDDDLDRLVALYANEVRQ